MKKINAFLVLTGLFISLCSQAQNLATAIKVQAMDMGNAVIKNDFNSFVKYMHPAIVSFAGGKETMKIKMDSAYSMMKQFGVTFKRYSIGNPGAVISYKGGLQAVLPQNIILKTPMGELLTETSLIALSNNKGKSWFFIDTNVYNGDKLKKILPDLSPKLVIPPRKQPKLVPVENS